MGHLDYVMTQDVAATQPSSQGFVRYTLSRDYLFSMGITDSHELNLILKAARARHQRRCLQNQQQLWSSMMLLPQAFLLPVAPLPPPPSVNINYYFTTAPTPPAPAPSLPATPPPEEPRPVGDDAVVRAELVELQFRRDLEKKKGLSRLEFFAEKRTPETHEALTEVLCELKDINGVTRKRSDVQSRPYRGFLLGLAGRAMGLQISVDTLGAPKLTKAILKFCSSVPEKSTRTARPFYFTSADVVYNVKAKKHVDAGNFGESAIMTLGFFSGGGLLVYDDPAEEEILNCHQNWTFFDGKNQHATEEYTSLDGRRDRISIILFCDERYVKMVDDREKRQLERDLRSRGFRPPPRDLPPNVLRKRLACRKVKYAPRPRNKKTIRLIVSCHQGHHH